MDNELESALRQAIADESKRNDFIELLLESDIFLIGGADLDQQGKVTSLKIAPWKTPKGKEFVPIFSSISYLRKVIAEDVDFVKINARAFFEATRGADVALNPYSNLGLGYTADDIAQMLD